MTITLQTADRLNIRCINPFGEGAFVSFDKIAARTTIFRLAWILPWWRTQVPLSRIREVKARKRERHDGTAVYGIVLRQQAGEDIRFGCGSRDDAMNTLRAIVQFLGHGQTAKPDDGHPAGIAGDIP